MQIRIENATVAMNQNNPLVIYYTTLYLETVK